MRTRSRWSLLSLCLAATATFCGCAGGSETAAGSSGSTAGAAHGTQSPDRTDVEFVLNYLPGGVSAGFSYAKQLGFYDEVGLNVTLTPGTGSVTTTKMVASGEADIGSADAASLFAVNGSGGDAQLVAVVDHVNSYAIMSLKDANITAASDLAGTSIGLQPGTAQASLLSAVLGANGLTDADVNIVNLAPTALVGALLQGTVDAILGGADGQAPILRAQGADINVLYFYQFGVPTVGLSMIANRDYAERHPDVVKRFVAASLRGWEATMHDPEAAAKAVVDQFPEAGSLEIVTGQTRIETELLCAAPGATVMGSVPDASWEATVELLSTYTGLPDSPDPRDNVTEKFLPDSPPACARQDG